MGRPVSGTEYLEGRLTDHLEQFAAARGWPYVRQGVSPERDNIVMRVGMDSNTELPPLIFEAHQDTVPVDGMIIPPWEPVQKNGRIYGRGACDIKGGMAAMLAAADRLGKLPKEERPHVVLAFTVNEEHGFTGATKLASIWNGEAGSDLTALIPQTPAGIIVAEPTLLNVVVTHKGVVRWKLRTLGIAGHSSAPDRCENAIYLMSDVVSALREYATNVVSAMGSGELPSEKLLSSPTLSVGIIQGGISVNTVPDVCEIEIDRRILPTEDPFVARTHAIEFLADRLGDDFPLEHGEPYIIAHGLSTANNSELSEHVATVARQFGGGEKVGAAYGTDASAYSPTAVPTVVIGPGSIKQAHTRDEWLEIEQLRMAEEVYYQIAVGGLQ